MGVFKPGEGLFGIRVRSQRRAKIISIRSPDEFRRSIREISSGRYTLGDQRALVLAQNRAKAMLKRKDLSSRERREFVEISKIKVPSFKRRK